MLTSAPKVVVVVSMIAWMATNLWIKLAPPKGREPSPPRIDREVQAYIAPIAIVMSLLCLFKVIDYDRVYALFLIGMYAILCHSQAITGRKRSVDQPQFGVARKRCLYRKALAFRESFGALTYGFACGWYGRGVGIRRTELLRDDVGIETRGMS